MLDKEKKLMELYQRLESQNCKKDLLFIAETMVRTHDAVKADYGLLPESCQVQTAQAGQAAAGQRV